MANPSLTTGGAVARGPASDASQIARPTPAQTRAAALLNLGCAIDTKAAALTSTDPTVVQGAMRELMKIATDSGLNQRDVLRGVSEFRTRQRQGPSTATDAHNLACAVQAQQADQARDAQQDALRARMQSGLGAIPRSELGALTPPRGQPEARPQRRRH